MTWIKHNWYILVLMGAILFTAVDSYVRDNSRDATLVTGCQSSSARAALASQGWSVLAGRVRQRGNAGDFKSAKEYQAVSDGMADEVPRPNGASNAQVIAVKTAVDQGHIKYVLTDQAKALQKKGCENRYH